MKELIKIEEELAQLKNSNTNNEECLVIDAANVYLLESKSSCRLLIILKKIGEILFLTLRGQCVILIQVK